MKEYKTPPDRLYDLVVSKDELENGCVNDDTFLEYAEKFLGEPNDTGGNNSTLQNFFGLQTVSDKVCADCIEAILGTCVKTIGVERTFKVLEMLEILPRQTDIDISKILHNKQRPSRSREFSNDDIDRFLVNHEKIENAIGYRFNDRAYLLEALTHSSFTTGRLTDCYQRLEFLGDAVLDFLVTAYIIERCPNLDPGRLTDLRSALVNNVTLACLCVRYNIHEHILYQNEWLSEVIARFVKYQNEHDHEVNDHVELLMAETDVEAKMADYVDVPKALGDVFEAIIAAIFLDSGNDLEVRFETFTVLS